MTWTFIWMMVVLKIPVIAILWLCWWAIREQPEPTTGGTGDDGGSGHPPRPQAPLSPRRGHHARRRRRASRRADTAGRGSGSVPRP